MILELVLSGVLATGPTHCQHAVIQQNSGAGPDTPVLVCDALRDSDGEGWFLVVDGGPLQPGAVILGFERP